MQADTTLESVGGQTEEKPKHRPVVYLVMPRAGPEIVYGAGAGLFHAGNGDYEIMLAEAAGSASQRNHNGSWYDCLNLKDFGAKKPTHYAMIHADVCPQPGWLDTYLAEMERLDADVISGVVSFRDFTGLTSTAIENPKHLQDPNELWAPRRLTLTEIARMPETFSIADTDTPNSRLLFNTGLMLINLRGNWQDEIDFQFLYRKSRLEASMPQLDGTMVPGGYRYFEMRSEDWELARFCGARKLKVYCTTKVEIRHVGPWAWSNKQQLSCPHCKQNFGQDTDTIYWQRQEQLEERKIVRSVQAVVAPQFAEMNAKLAKIAEAAKVDLTPEPQSCPPEGQEQSMTVPTMERRHGVAI
jgi:hypothetical protein